jgi:cell division septum initiation protein DivIVA
VPLRPEDLDVSGLPRSPFGGVKADATAELLRRAAWEYREALAQNTRLTRTVEELNARIEELEAEVVSLEATSAERKDPDELARALLASAQRLAREQREAARHESELLLKKVRARAREIEDGARKRAGAQRSELARLQAVRAELSGELRKAVEAMLALGADLPAAADDAPPARAVPAGQDEGAPPRSGSEQSSG